MLKIHEGTFQILEWKGEEYYRFGPRGWMQLMGCSLEEVYDQEELEAAYQVNEAERERLVMLSEECAEVIQAVSKILRHGWDSVHPDTGVRNDEHLRTELDDLQAIIWRMELTDCTQADPASVWERKKKRTHHQ